MPGCLLSCRMPTAWCGTPRNVLKPSAEVRSFLLGLRALGVSTLSPVGLRSGAFAGLAQTPYMRPLETEVYCLLCGVSHLGGSPILG